MGAVNGRTRAARIVAVLLCGIAGGVALGLWGALASLPAALLWWLGRGAMTRSSAAWVLGASVVLHGALALSGFQSNDLARYLWEGRVQLEGGNPYTTPPADASLEALRDERFTRVAHPGWPSLYPPLAQASFVLAAALGADELDYRNAIALLDLAVVALLIGWLRATGRPVGRAAWYAWCPLAVVAAVGGHVDVLMVAGLLGFAWCWETGRFRGAAACLAAAILAKTAAVVVLPWALWRRPRVVASLVLPLLALAYLPYALAGGAAGSLVSFAETFRFNALVYPWLASLAGGTALAAALALIAWVAVVTIREERPADAAALALIGLLVLSPVVHYWYLSWFLVLLPAVEGRLLRAGGLAWAASIALLAPVYLSIAGGEPLPPSAGLRLAEALPPLAAVAFTAWRARRATASPPRKRLEVPLGAT